jgi:hypothetical protein
MAGTSVKESRKLNPEYEWHNVSGASDRTSKEEL